MSYDIDKIISFIKSEPSLNLSPVARQVLVTRISFEPTQAEIDRARDLIMGRVPAGNPN